MKQCHKFEADVRLATHVMRTLPDSLQERTVLLRMMLLVLPRGHGLRLSAKTQLLLIEQMNMAQREFDFADNSIKGAA